MNTKQWGKQHVWPFFGFCTADSQTDAGRHQLYNNVSLVLFSTPWSLGTQTTAKRRKFPPRKGKEGKDVSVSITLELGTYLER